MRELFREAVHVALRSEMRKRYGCIIVLGKRVLGSGFNKRLGFKFREDDDERHSFHAERNAIISLNDRKILQRAKILLVRIDRKGNIYPAEPCPLCSRYLKRLGVVGVYTLAESISVNEFI